MPLLTLNWDCLTYTPTLHLLVHLLAHLQLFGNLFPLFILEPFSQHHRTLLLRNDLLYQQAVAEVVVVGLVEVTAPPLARSHVADAAVEEDIGTF